MINFWDINIRALVATSLVVIAFALSYIAFGRSNKKAHR